MGTERTALLIMDLQPEIVARLDDDELLVRISAAARAARSAGVRVIYVRIAFREGYPEIGRSSPMFSRLASLGGFIDGQSTPVHPAVAPESGDIIVTKKRVSAFAGSDLEVILRAGAIDTLVLTGIATSGVVLSTLRQAADLDFTLTVLADGCGDRDEEVHRVLCDKVFPRQATVTTVAEWIGSID